MKWTNADCIRAMDTTVFTQGTVAHEIRDSTQTVLYIDLLKACGGAHSDWRNLREQIESPFDEQVELVSAAIVNVAEVQGWTAS